MRTSWPRGSRGKNGATEFLSKTAFHTATGETIGDGSYGSVVEVAIPGAVCAAKKIHDFFLDPKKIPRKGIEKAVSEFVKECQLMSTLRHPHIVQFLGVCFLPESRIPALVMEKLVTSLHTPSPRHRPSPTSQTASSVPSFKMWPAVSRFSTVTHRLSSTATCPPETFS